MTSLRFVVVGDIYTEAAYVNLAATLEQLRRENEQCVLLVSGDVLGGSAMCESTKGRHVIEILNALRVDCAAVGNHEFDFTESNLAARVADSQFAWLGANIRVDAQPLGGVRDCVTLVRGGLKVGVLGVITRDTPHLSFPGKAVAFDDAIAVAKRCAAHLRNVDQCDIVVALTHLAFDDDKRLAAEADVDLVFGGHDHSPMSTVVSNSAARFGRALVMKPGMNAHWAGVIDVELRAAKLSVCARRRGKRRRRGACRRGARCDRRPGRVAVVLSPLR